MANLTAVFELVDRISGKLDAIASSGESAISQWNRAEDAADSAFSTAESGGQRAATAADGVASSVQEMGDSMADASRAMDDAASSTDYWTDAVGNYSKEALEAVYTTEELVEMGFKSEEALEAEAKAAEEAEKALDDLEEQSEDTGKAQEDMGSSGVEAITAISNTVIAAAIAKKFMEMAEAAYALADAYSTAEKTIVNATGATGEALDSLGTSLLDAYSMNDDSLDETAAAIGEINTRLGYTGPLLTKTTAMFMDFADATGGRAANSVRSVTQLMRQWEVPTDEMGSLLDRLTYAGQVSGISVDNLSSQLTSNKAVLDQLGFSLDQSIAMFSQFELNGTQAATVMTGFRTALSKGVISSLEDLNEVFDKIATGEMDAAEAAEIFGGRASTQIVNAVKQGALSLDDMVASLEAAEGCLEKTAAAGESLGEKWEKASNSMSAAFTRAVEPTLSKFSAGFAGIVTSIGDFLNEHPVVTKAITAVGVGVGVVAVGIVGVGVASLKSIPAVAAFGTTLTASLGPIGWVALAITAVTAGVMLLVDALDNYEDETAEMTAATRAQYLELQDLNSQYEEACAKYGETSEEALRLKYQVDDLNESFQKNRQTMEEFLAECQKVVDAHADMVESFETNRSAIESSSAGTFTLIQKLSDLADGTYKTADSQGAMKAIIDTLNKSVDGLNVSYTDLVLNQADTIQNIRDMAKAQAEQERQQERYEEYIKLLNQQADEEAQLAKAVDEVTLAQERANEANAAYNTMYQNMTRYDTTGFAALGAMFTNEAKAAKNANEKLGEAKTAHDELAAVLDDTNARIKELEESWGLTEEAITSMSAAEQYAARQTEEVNARIIETANSIETLTQKYNEAYEAAYKSVSGQYDLWDKADEVVATSVSNINSNLEGQISYWDNYNANLESLRERTSDIEGLQEVIASFADGSKESVNAIAGLAAASDEDLATMVASYQALQKAQEATSASLADLKTNFSNEMDDLQRQLVADVEKMNLCDDAADAGAQTIQGFIDGAEDLLPQVEAAYARIANAAANALSKNSRIAYAQNQVAYLNPYVSMNAEGTASAEDVFIAGEEGPELIVGKRGSTVFPVEETQKIINAVSNEQERGAVYYLPPASLDNGAGSRTETSGGDGVKKVVLEIEGKGNLELTGGKVDDETLLAFLYDYIKPVLADVITQEAFEEGDFTHEY